MDELDIDQELLEDEWLEEEPTLTTKNVGVICDECDKVSLLRYHMARSGFSFTCNKCRLKQAKRKAQLKYSAKNRTALARTDSERIDALLGKLDRRIMINNRKIVEFNQLQPSPDEPITYMQKLTQKKRIELNEIYLRVRVKVMEDLLYRREKSLDEYLREFRKAHENTRRQGKGRNQEAVEELRA